MNEVIIRQYKSTDCKYLSELFYDTIHSVNAGDYNEEQLNSWASGKIDLEIYNRCVNYCKAFF